MSLPAMLGYFASIQENPLARKYKTVSGWIIAPAAVISTGSVQAAAATTG
jgi:hypothetical protein